MGLPMAVNLQKSGNQVKAFDISENNLKAAKEQGLEPATTVSAVAKDVLPARAKLFQRSITWLLLSLELRTLKIC